jgi:general secretion pathway protein L
VQVRALEHLPPVKDSALKQLVAQQAGRFFRKNGKPLITDAVWMQRGRGQEGVAQAAAVEEPWIEAIAAGARAAGLVLEEIHPQHGEQTLRKLSLVSPAERARRRRMELLALRRLAIAAGLLWMIATGAFAIRVQRAQGQVERRLAALKAPLDAVAAARRELAGAVRMVETIEEAERDRGRVLLSLAAITKALPDSSYLTSLALDEHEGTMTGLARQAAGVVAALERDATIAGPRLTGPVVREVSDGKELERFTLSFVSGVAP